MNYSKYKYIAHAQQGKQARSIFQDSCLTLAFHTVEGIHKAVYRMFQVLYLVAGITWYSLRPKIVVLIIGTLIAEQLILAQIM